MDKTPGTRGRWGMSVGIDWTSHPLHSCDDSETCGSEKLATIMRTTIYIGSFTIADVHFFLSPALFSCVPKCKVYNRQYSYRERQTQRESQNTQTKGIFRGCLADGSRKYGKVTLKSQDSRLSISSNEWKPKYSRSSYYFTYSTELIINGCFM